MTLPTPTPLTDAEIAELIAAASSPDSTGCGEFDLRIVGAKGRATRRLVATITSLQSDLAAAEERATYYAANARSEGPSDGSIYAAVSAMDAIKRERAALARAEAAESDLQDAKAEIERWKASFAGHLYVTNEDYSAWVNRAKTAESDLQRTRGVLAEALDSFDLTQGRSKYPDYHWSVKARAMGVLTPPTGT